MSNLAHLATRSFASSALRIVKMKQFVPCDVQNQFGTYKARIVDVVYDPLNFDEVNRRFTKAGYGIDNKDVRVIAVNEDESILVWDGFTIVYALRKGEKISKSMDRAHMAFNDITVLTNLFKQIKVTKPEVEDLVEKVRQLYAGKRTPAKKASR